MTSGSACVAAADVRGSTRVFEAVAHVRGQPHVCVAERVLQRCHVVGAA
jgi:hypothetical protein